MEILYFDDIPKDLETYSRVLREKLASNVTGTAPPPSMDTAGLPSDVDLILIDWELTQKNGSAPPASYRGGALASRLAEVYRDIPLVALSRPSIFRELKVTQSNLQSLDDWVFKEDLKTKPSVSTRLLGLVEGFETLRKLRPRNWKNLLSAMGARQIEEDLLKAAGPPLLMPEPNKRATWSVHEASNWIRRVVMEYPGIFYDEAFAAAGLGVSESSFLSIAPDLFTDAKYSGIFSRGVEFWWRGRLYEIAQSVISRAAMNGPIHSTFSNAFAKVFKRNLEASTCVFSKEPHADTICYLLKRPVKREYTLEYLPDNRPAVMEPARVSFKAIRESNAFDPDFLPASAKPLLKAIRR